MLTFIDIFLCFDKVQILFVPPKETKELVMLDDEEAKQSQASFKIATSEQVIISVFL
jgi:hypothetical protein